MNAPFTVDPAVLLAKGLVYSSSHATCGKANPCKAVPKQKLSLILTLSVAGLIYSYVPKHAISYFTGTGLVTIPIIKLSVN